MSKDSNMESGLSQLSTIFGNGDRENKAFDQGLKNLAMLPEFDPEEGQPVPGKEFSAGVMGFRRTGRGLQLAVACGKAMVRYIDLGKFIAMVENLHDSRTATIMLENFQEQDDKRPARGQILGRINAQYSAVTIIQGVSGRIIRGPSDIALFDVYYIDRKDMTAFYLAAKSQISNADTLETMIAAFDGWKAFDVPLNPLDPYELSSIEQQSK